jgi:hypothetical protein
VSLPLHQAQTLYDSGRFDAALTLLRQLATAAEPTAAAMRLSCMTAFRVGELAESADAAQAVLHITDAGSQPGVRFDVLALSVVAAGELARFDQAMAHLSDLLALASRSGSGLKDYVRARGTAATCFALLGDPWAGQRLLCELIGLFQGLTDQPQLEAAVRGNHTSVCLQLARWARQGGDEPGATEAMEHAQASQARALEIAEQTQDARIKAFANVHDSELALLQGDPARALARLDGAIAQADASGLRAHGRQLRLLEADALLDGSDCEGALTHLAHVAASIGPGHEVGARIRLHALLHRAHLAQGDTGTALSHLEQSRMLAQWHHYRQQQAQSRYLRTRLELEHLYRYPKVLPR